VARAPPPLALPDPVGRLVGLVRRRALPHRTAAPETAPQRVALALGRDVDVEPSRGVGEPLREEDDERHRSHDARDERGPRRHEREHGGHRDEEAQAPAGDGDAHVPTR
jgi:hypothetical protein